MQRQEKKKSDTERGVRAGEMQGEVKQKVEGMKESCHGEQRR